MPYKYMRVCPLCQRPTVKHLSSHLSMVHGLNGHERTPHLNKNSAEVDIAPAFGEITTACNVSQAKNGSWCLLEE